MNLWIVGRVRNPERPADNWEFMGVFNARSRALNAATNNYDFIAPVRLNERCPENSVDFIGIEYPNLLPWLTVREAIRAAWAGETDAAITSRTYNCIKRHYYGYPGSDVPVRDDSFTLFISELTKPFTHGNALFGVKQLGIKQFAALQFAFQSYIREQDQSSSGQ